MKIGDKVTILGKSYGEKLSMSGFEIGDISNITNVYSTHDKIYSIDGSLFLQQDLELINNKTIMTNVKEKFIGLFTKEPEKSYIKAGLMDNNKIATEDGIRIFVSYLMTKSDDFKTEVVDKMLKEEKGDK